MEFYFRLWCPVHNCQRSKSSMKKKPSVDRQPMEFLNLRWIYWKDYQLLRLCISALSHGAIFGTDKAIFGENEKLKKSSSA